MGPPRQLPATRRDAEAARDELLEQSRAERTTQTWTVVRLLERSLHFEGFEVTCAYSGDAAPAALRCGKTRRI